MKDPDEVLKRYRNWSPTQFDTKGLNLEDRQDWFVAPVILTRDSGALERSNFQVVRNDLEVIDENSIINKHGLRSGFTQSDIEVHRFDHWGPGWFEIILVRPDSKVAESAVDWACSLSDYPVASDEHYSAVEQEEADETWRKCYSDRERLEYIKKHRRQFEFRDWQDLLGCVRGKYFAGYPGELL